MHTLRAFIFFIILGVTVSQRLLPARQYDELGLDDDSYVKGEEDDDENYNTTTAMTTTTTPSTTTQTTTTLTTTTTNENNNNTKNTNKFIKRVAAAIKEEIKTQWTQGEIGGLISGLISIVAFLIFFIYSVVMYVRSQDQLTFAGLRTFMLGLCLEHVFRIRPRQNEAAAPGRLAIQAA